MWERFTDALLKYGSAAFIALIAFSWIYVAINGSSSRPGSWGEYYESSAR